MINYSGKAKIILPIMFIVMLITALLLGKLLREKNERIKTIPLVVITILLILLEIIKQIWAICVSVAFLQFICIFFPNVCLLWWKSAKFWQNDVFCDFILAIWAVLYQPNIYYWECL